MMNTTLIYNFGQTVLASKGKSKAQVKAKDPEENLIIEDYEGECEKCQNTKPQKTCSICGE